MNEIKKKSLPSLKRQANAIINGMELIPTNVAVSPMHDKKKLITRAIKWSGQQEAEDSNGTIDNHNV